MVKHLHMFIFLAGMNTPKLEKCLLNMYNVLMPSYMTVIFKGIKEHTL